MTLNKAHPIYNELRALLLSLGGSAGIKGPHGLSVEAESYDVDRLFGRPLRTAVLLTLHASPRKEMDAASMHRLLPEYDVGKIAQALRRFQQLGLLGTRRWKTVIYYTFDKDYPQHASLQRLLAAINRQWPEYAASAHTNELLYPEGRQRMHRYRH